MSNINSCNMLVSSSPGMLTAEQAVQLKEAGLTAYNHNLGDYSDTMTMTIDLPLTIYLIVDTSREYYPSITTTRTYDDRLRTVENVRNAGISVCCGGILGLGNADTASCMYCMWMAIL